MHLRLAPPTADHNDPMLVIDSGLGGLTVAAAMMARLPGERIVYVGDTARVPYGSKSPRAICRAVSQIVTAASRELASTGGGRFKHVVVACNSASAVALPAAQAAAPGAGVSGVIAPGARAAARAAGPEVGAVIGVLATEATVRSGAYECAVARRRPRARLLLKAAPLLVPVVEEGRSPRDKLARLAVKQYLRPLLRRAREIKQKRGGAGGLDALVLGCTHYPLLIETFREVAGDRLPLIDSAAACAGDVAQRLSSAGLLADANRAGGLRLMATDLPERFGRMAGRFLGVEAAPTPELLEVDDEEVADLPPIRRTA